MEGMGAYLPINTELRKPYRENTKSQTYIDQCLLITNCRITLEQARYERNALTITGQTYLEDSSYHFLLESADGILVSSLRSI